MEGVSSGGGAALFWSSPKEGQGRGRLGPVRARKKEGVRERPWQSPALGPEGAPLRGTGPKCFPSKCLALNCNTGINNDG